MTEDRKKRMMAMASAYLLRQAALDLGTCAQELFEVNKIEDKSDTYTDITDVLVSIKQFQDALEFYMEHRRK